MEDIRLLQQTLKQAHEQQLKDLASQYSEEGKAQTERSMAEMEARLQERHHREIVGVVVDVVAHCVEFIFSFAHYLLPKNAVFLLAYATIGAVVVDRLTSHSFTRL